MLKKFYEFKEADLEPIKSFYLKDELNPKLWEDFDIDKEVREDLLQIAQDFYESTDITADVVDIVLCGSLCNYNWSKYSDYDLHIIIRYKDIDENIELAEQLCDYAKKIWNSMHDITIKGYEVEVAIQDEDDFKKAIKTGRMGGAFSLMNNEWVKRPEKVDFEPDEKMISSKAKTIMGKVDDIEDQIDEDNYSSFKEKIDKIWTKIKDLRKSGLDSESGEYSIGNLMFKLLRRNGYIGKIMEMKRYAYDKQFESSSDELSNLFYSLDDISNRLDKMNNDSYLSYEHDEENQCVEVSYGHGSQSDGFNDNIKIYYSKSPIIVERVNKGSGSLGEWKGDRSESFNSLEEIIADIKTDFGM